MQNPNEALMALDAYIKANPGLMAGLTAILVWSLIWKGIALWKAARLSHKTWFVILLLANTIGILDIIYIFGVARKQEKAESGQDDGYGM